MLIKENDTLPQLQGYPVRKVDWTVTTSKGGDSEKFLGHYESKSSFEMD
jgi:hypothetical protein